MQSIRSKVVDSFTFRKISENRYLSLLLLVNFLLRFPRVDGIIGNDAFVLLWTGTIIKEGALINWTISPLSFFGMYPFSVYPIGIPAITGILFWLGLSSESLVLLLSMSFGMVGVIGSWYMGKEVFPDIQSAFIFSAAYSISHVFFRFTYFTLSARGAFLAILPWFLWASIKYLRGKNLRYGLFSGVFLLALFLTHGLALYAIVLFSIAFLGYQFLRTTENYVKRRANSEQKLPWKLPDDYFWIILIVGILIGYIAGLILLPIDPSKTAPVLMSNDTIIGITINLVVDYGLRLGILSCFLPIGIIGAFHCDYATNRRWLHLVLIPLTTFSIPMSTYASVIFLPVLTYYSVYGFMFLWQKISKELLVVLLLSFTFVFGMLYHLFIVNLPPFALGFALLVGVLLIGLLGLWTNSYIQKTSFNLTRRTGWGFVLIAIMCFSIIATDGLIQTDDRSGLTSDEVAIAEFLNSHHESGVVFVYDVLLARRLQSFGIPAMKALNEGFMLYSGFITPDEIIQNTEVGFRLDSFLSGGDIYTYYGRYPERELFRLLYYLDLSNSTEYPIAIENGLEFVLVEKTEYGYGDTYNGAFCPLLHSTPLASELIFEVDTLALFRLTH